MVKDNFEISADIINDLYQLDISQYKLKAKASNYQGQTNLEATFFYIDYINKCIKDNGNFDQKLSENELITVKKRVFNLLLLLKHQNDEFSNKMINIEAEILEK